jgi:hypothetical protein
MSSEESMRIVVEFPPGWFDRVDRLLQRMNRVSRKRRRALKAKLARMLDEPKINGRAGLR